MRFTDRLPNITIPRLGRRRQIADTADQTEAAGEEPGGLTAPAAGQILRGYGPLAAFALVFVLMAGFVPTVNQNISSNSPGYVPPVGGGGPDVPPVATGDTDDVGAVAPAEGQAAAGTVSGPVSSAGGGGPKVAAQAGRGAGSCAGKTKQVPGDPYSPPCIEFPGGTNGGVTHRGVTADTVKVSFRVINEKGFLQTLATLAGAEIVDTPADIKRTVEAFEEFFNKHYQFYGRKIDIIFHNGKGSTTTELLGGGRAEAEADAATVADTIGAFVEMNASSEPFAQGLAKKGVIGFGTPYLSRGWHNTYSPYAYSIATDCTVVALAAAELTWKSLINKPAKFAGGELKDKTRKIGGLSPENEWYQVCHQEFIDDVGKHGGDATLKVNYKLDINSMSNQAASVVAKFKDEGATTILCGCDPIFPVFLSSKANEQGYKPEWIIIGVALTDWSVSGQLYNQEQWSRAFGISALGEPRPIRAGLGYSAYKSIRQDEPAFAVELIYGSLLMIASGVQMAGPVLNPPTFEAGLQAWPGGTGPYGTWGLNPGDHTPTRDYRVVWWSPTTIAIENNQPGQYIASFGGKRFPVGQFPAGDLPVFTE